MPNFCPVCNISLNPCAYARHCRSQKHLKAVENQQEKQNEVKEEKHDTQPDDDLTTTGENVEVEVEEFSLCSENFLRELENEAFGIEPQEKNKNELNLLKETNDKIKIENQKAKLQRLEKERMKISQKENEDLDENEEILGKEKRVLLAKITMYRNMFKDELKNNKFRIKKGASVADLKAILEELEVVVSINGMEQFTMDVIFASIKIIEMGTSRFDDFDITGLSENLKENEQFQKLTKILFIKHQSFANVPPEYQMIFIVLVNAVICARMNKQKKVQLKHQATV